MLKTIAALTNISWSNRCIYIYIKKKRWLTTICGKVLKICNNNIIVINLSTYVCNSNTKTEMILTKYKRNNLNQIHISVLLLLKYWIYILAPIYTLNYLKYVWIFLDHVLKVILYWLVSFELLLALWFLALWWASDNIAIK